MPKLTRYGEANMKKYYAVIDTNVLVSAFMKEESIPDRITSHILDGKIIPLLNDKILQEYREVMHRTKFHFDKDAVDSFLMEISQRGVVIDGWEADILLPDPKDVVFYAVVMEAREEQDAYLVTGNIKHFPKAVFVVTPREMLTLVETGKLPSRD